MTARGFTLADLLAGIDGARVRGDAGVAVAEVRDDSRQVARGDLFIAVPGTVVDGRKFLADLLNKLSDQQIRDLFEVSQVTRRDKTSTIDGWVNAFKQKRDEVSNRVCTS